MDDKRTVEEMEIDVGVNHLLDFYSHIDSEDEAVQILRDQGVPGRLIHRALVKYAKAMSDRFPNE